MSSGAGTGQLFECRSSFGEIGCRSKLIVDRLLLMLWYQRRIVERGWLA